MARGSLGDNLFSGEQKPLSWDVRMKIAIDAASGLSYLHENERPVIHCNVKPSKILLDTAYNAKIFGFGFAIARPDGQESEILDVIVGTAGYVAPEYFLTWRVSTKSDVYSFGVVLVELLSGRKWKDLLSEEPGGLAKWTLNFLEGGESLHKLMDARLAEEYPIEGAKEVAKLARKCLDKNPQERPSMGEIVDILRSLLELGTFEYLAGPVLEKVANDRTSGSTSQSEVKNQGSVLMRAGLGLIEPPTTEEWLSAKQIYLMQSQVAELPERPRCPKLRELYMPRNCKLRRIPNSFFEYMPVLQVLNLSRTRIKTLPDSLFGLCCLKRLFLNHCKLLTVLSPKIGELKELEVLDLHGTEIIDLPKETVNLTNLRCLELSFCSDFDPDSNVNEVNVLIPNGTLSALSQLEELSIDVDPEDQRWEKDVGAIVDDICGLQMLNTLNLYFPDLENLMNFSWGIMFIECFKFTVGRHVNCIMSRFPQDLHSELEKWDRCLKYVNGMGIPTGFKNVLYHSTAFFLDRHATATNLSEFGIDNMQQLKCCIIGECNEVLYILDGFNFLEEGAGNEIVSEYSSDECVLGSLEYLHIYYMRSLRGIYTGPYRKCLCNLKSLTIQTCPELAVIFTPELLGDLFNLEELIVEDCEVVTSLVTSQDSTVFRSSSFLPKLRRMSLHNLPELVSISHGFHIAPKLELLSLRDCPKLSLSAEEVGSKHLTKMKEEASLPFSITSSSEAKQSSNSLEKFVEVEAKTWSSEGKSADGTDKQSRAFEGKSDEVKAEPSRSREDKSAEGISIGEVVPTPQLRVFSLAELIKATRNSQLDTMLVQGTSGRVFKGYIDEDPGARIAGTQVAIKVLNSESMIFEDWESEVTFRGSLSHPNIVRLLGYCLEEKKGLLVYEYLEKGCLEDHLLKKFARRPLPWNLRLKIAVETAKGLAFLHQLETPIIHADIKASNILLDADYNAKLSSFGLAREGPVGDNFHVSTEVMGTFGYVAPEYVASGHRSVKLNVYSFGVVLLEMLTGLRAFDVKRPPGQKLMVEWVTPLVWKRKLEKFIDPKLGKQYPVKDALAVAMLALDCLQNEPSDRPLMTEVLERLEKIAG